jgi:hypothetical protein
MDYAVAGLPPHVPDHLTVTMIVRFELHLVPLWSWHRSRQFRWDMMKDSNGTPFWIPGYIEQ